MTARTVDVCIPVLNEAHVLAKSVNTVREFCRANLPYRWRVVVVDNGSTDGTQDVARRLVAESPEEVGFLHLEQRGRGRALRHAWLSSTADAVSYMDVDLSTELAALPKVLRAVLEEGYDVATGSRLQKGRSKVTRSRKRYIISKSYNIIVRRVLGVHFSDAQCGFKAIRSDVAKDLLPLVEDEGWFFDTELLVLAEHNGLRIHEVPVDWVDDPDSRVDVVRTAQGDLLGIWRMVRRLSRGTASLTSRTFTTRHWVEPGLAGQLVRFASVGVVSTVLFALLFAVLADPLGSFLGAIVAMAVCSVANTAANRRLTFALRGSTDRVRHFASGLVLNLMPLSVTLLTLGLLDLADVTSRPAQIAWLTAANATATVARFVLLRTWVFSRRPMIRARTPVS